MNNTPRLADRIRARREQLRLSVRRASRDARVTRITWDRWEKGTLPYERHWRAIERVLGWEPGSVQVILAGGEPATIDHLDPVTMEQYTDPVERRLWELWPAFALDGDAEDGQAQAREHIYKFRRDRAARRGHQLHTPRNLT